MAQVVPRDPPDGEDEQGVYWECPECSNRCRTGPAERDNCCRYD